MVQTRNTAAPTYLFSAENADWLVERAVETAVNGLIGSMPVDEVLTIGKSRMQIEAIHTAQTWLDRYQTGIELLNGNLQTVSPPVPVLDAFKDVSSAKKDAERLIDEARAYESRVIPEARGEAQRTVSRAQGFQAARVNQAQGDASRFLSLLAEYRKAKEVTRTRLFLETMQELLAKMKVVVLEAGQNKITIVDN